MTMSALEATDHFLSGFPKQVMVTSSRVVRDRPPSAHEQNNSIGVDGWLVYPHRTPRGNIALYLFPCEAQCA